MSWTHKYSLNLSAEPEAVFRALTQPAEMTRWFAERVDIGLKRGGPYRFWGKHTLGAPTEGESRQAVTRLEPGRTLGFSWPLYGVGTEVTLSVAPEKDGSTITVEHKIDADLGVTRQKELIDDHWRLAFGNLASHLAGGDGVLLPDYTDPSPEVRLTITIDAPPEQVFRALIEPEAINRWFGTNSAVVEARVGGI